MSISLFFSPINYSKSLVLTSPITLKELCARAGVTCKATGPWTNREVEIVSSKENKLVAEPGDWGKIRVELNTVGELQQARAALAAIAYELHDLVAKQSILGADWINIKAPRGRPKKGKVLTSAERQRRFREKLRLTKSQDS